MRQASAQRALQSTEADAVCHETAASYARYGQSSLTRHESYAMGHASSASSSGCGGCLSEAPLQSLLHKLTVLQLAQEDEQKRLAATASEKLDATTFVDTPVPSLLEDECCKEEEEENDDEEGAVPSGAAFGEPLERVWSECTIVTWRGRGSDPVQTRVVCENKKQRLHDWVLGLRKLHFSAKELLA